VTDGQAGDVGQCIRVQIGGRSVVIRRLYTEIWNAFDADTGERLVVAVDLGDGWWLAVRIGRPRRHMHVPEGVAEVTRRLLTE